MLQLPATLVQENANEVLAQLMQALGTETTASVTINAGALTQFDSTALAVLLELRRAVHKLGKTLCMQAVPGRFADLARLYGIAELLPVQADAGMGAR
jgi:phospholipid transport system transporter-binding protein